MAAIAKVSATLNWLCVPAVLPLQELLLLQIASANNQLNWAHSRSHCRAAAAVAVQQMGRSKK